MNKISLLFCLGCLPFVTVAQKDTFYLDYKEAIHLVLANSMDLKLAKSQLLENKYAQEQYALSLKPSVNLDAITPNLSRSIEARPLPDGRDAFVNRSTMYNSINLNPVSYTHLTLPTKA